MVACVCRIKLGASQLIWSATMKRLLATSLLTAVTYAMTLLAGTLLATAMSSARVSWLQSSPESLQG
jgi:hypothetical protein